MTSFGGPIEVDIEGNPVNPVPDEEEEEAS
ncbi:hypothetical protein OURE66S_04145 [Oligella ureolytica]